MAKLIVIAGPSGAGKGTLIQNVLGRFADLVVSVSATTRLRRHSEVEGRDYFFLTKDEFARWVADDRFLEWAEYSHNLYGTPKHWVEKELDRGHDVILEIELEGARQVLQECPEAALIFIMPPSVAELRRRLLARKTEDPEMIEIRLRQAEKEMAAVQGRVWPGRRQFDYVIVNDTVERASAELAADIQEIRDKDHEQTHR